MWEKVVYAANPECQLLFGWGFGLFVFVSAAGKPRSRVNNPIQAYFQITQMIKKS